MNEDLHDKIEAYLEGTLKEEELAAFEQALVADEALAAEVGVFALEKEGHELLVEGDLRDKMRLWNADKHTDGAPASLPPAQPLPKAQPLRPKLRALGWWIGLAASLLLVLVYFYANRNPRHTAPITQKIPLVPRDSHVVIPPDTPPVVAPNTHEKDDRYRLLAIANYRQPDFSNETNKSDGSGATEPLQVAIDAWKADQFSAVIAAAKVIPPESPVYLRAQEMLGHALFKTKDFAAAAQVFAGISRADTGELGESANWHWALSLLAGHQLQAAKPLLEAIGRDTGNPKQGQAKAILKQL